MHVSLLFNTTQTTLSLTFDVDVCPGLALPPLMCEVIKYQSNICLFVALQAGTMVMIKEPDTVNKEAHQQTAATHRPWAEPAAKKSRAPVKPPQDPDAVFPCKKCGRYGRIITDIHFVFISN